MNFDLKDVNRNGITTYLYMIYGISSKFNSHERTKYRLFNLLGDFGGVM